MRPALNSILKTMRIKYLVISLSILLLGACGEDASQSSGKQVETIPGGNSVSDIIRNPVSLSGTDTVNVAKMTFDYTEYNFGTVKQGDIVTHTFNFVNTGKTPLIITDASSTCGCTVPSWPKDPIPPGDKGKIEVKFDTKNKSNRQHKQVTILANTYPSGTKLHVRGMVDTPDGSLQ